MHRADRVLVGLLLATGLTWAAGRLAAGAVPVWLGPLVLLLAAAKAACVAWVYMGLHHAPRLWQRLVLGWVLAVTVMLALLPGLLRVMGR